MSEIEILGNISIDSNIHWLNIENINVNDDAVFGDINIEEQIYHNISIHNIILWNFQNIEDWVNFMTSVENAKINLNENIMTYSIISRDINTTLQVDISKNITFKILIEEVSNIGYAPVEFELSGYYTDQYFSSSNNFNTYHVIILIVMIIVLILPIIKFKYLVTVGGTKKND